MRNWIDIIAEQSMRTSQKSGDNTKKYFDHFSQKIEEFKWISHIDNYTFDIFEHSEGGGKVYLITSNGNPAAYFQTTPFSEDAIELRHGYTTEEFRGNKLTEYFCWFIKTRLGKHLIMDEFQSPAAIGSIKSLSASGRFEMSWVRGQEKQPYDPSTVEQFMSVGKPTGWRVMLEADWPTLVSLEGTPFPHTPIGEWYTGLFE